MTDSYTPQRISPRNGPSVIFQGKLIAGHEWDAGTCDMRFEVWETPAGAYIAATFWINGDGPNDTESEVSVVDPIEDHFAMQCAVLEHFGWHFRARSMVKKALKWILSREVA